MRVVLDTNIFIAALITKNTLPDRLYQAWRDGHFTLLTCETQIEEMRRVTRREQVRLHIRPVEAGRMVNDLRDLAVMVDGLHVTQVARDPHDDYLLALATAGGADYLVTGDKRDLLCLERHGHTRILSARNFASSAGFL